MSPLAQLGKVLVTLATTLLSPGSNMKVALPLYGTIALLLSIVMTIVFMRVMTVPVAAAAQAGSTERHKRTRHKSPAARSLDRKARLFLGLGIAVLFAGVWGATGFTTSDPALCKGCHWPSSAHAKAATGEDPHAQVACVTCHEPGGVVGRYVTDVPVRVLHIAVAWSGVSNETGYGHAASRACASCHATALIGTKTSLARGLKVSHAEPLAASASCIDCHSMRGGIVSVHNAGMTPCLRCHNGSKASSACVTCHEGNTTAAARVRTSSLQNVQIPDVSCGGCHTEKQTCDPCHGVRMPHTSAFKQGAHARAAAVDIWYDGGKVCGRCHTATRYPCGRCHSTLLGRAHGNALASTHYGATSSRCNTCHQELATPATRDFCKDVCHSPVAMAASPR